MTGEKRDLLRSTKDSTHNTIIPSHQEYNMQVYNQSMWISVLEKDFKNKN